MTNEKIDILLIEDDLAEAGLIREMLAKSRTHEFSVEHVQYLADGLVLLKDRSFDCVLVDLGLPDSQGLETALTVRAHAKLTPVAIITILDDEELAFKALEMDIQDYLIKGEITSPLLVRSIRYAIQRKRVAEELRESEERFASFMRHMPAAAWMKDLHGRYVYVNAEAARIFSAPLPALQGKTDTDIFPPETARQFRKNDRRALAKGGGSIHTTEVLREADGIDHYFIVNKFAINAPDGTPAYVAGVALDITERKRAEEEVEQLNAELSARAIELERSNNELNIYQVELEAQNEELLRSKHETEELRDRYQDLYDFAPVGYFTLNERGAIVEANLAGASFLGKTRSELANYPLPMSLAAESRNEFEHFLRRVFASNARERCEVQLGGADPTSRWVLMEGIGSIDSRNGRKTCRLALIDITERVQAEEALQKSENKFSMIFNMAPVGITISTLADGRFVDINAAGERFSGYRRDEVIGHTALEFDIWKDPQERVKTIEEILKQGGVREREMLMKDKGGNPFWASYSAVVIEIRGEKYLLSLVNDITERKRAEEALKDSEERFRALVTASSEVVYRMSPDWSEMRQLYSQKFLASTVDPSRTWLQEYIHPDDQPHVTATIQEAIRTKSIFELEHRVFRADGSLGWTFSRAVPLMDANGEIVEWFGAASDITDRKEAEGAVQKSEKKFAKIFNAAPVLIGISTLEDGKYIDVNETALRLLGYRRDEVIGRTARELNLWEDPSAQARVSKTLEEEGSIKDIEVRFRGKSGQIFTGLLSAELVNFNGDRYRLGLVKDITDRKLAEEEIEQLHTQLAARAAELEVVNKQLAYDLEVMTTLQKLGMVYLHEEKIENILSEIVVAAVALSDADFGNIQIWDTKSSCLRIVAYSGFPQWWIEYWSSVQEGRGVCGTALDRGERVIVEDIEQSPIFTGTDALEIQLRAGVRAVQSTPLISRAGSLLGMFSTHYKAPHRPDERELRLLDLFARQAADTIEKTQLSEMLEAHAAELESANRELETFNYSVAHDLRKPLTVVNGYCQAIREFCGDKLNEKCTEFLQEAYDGTVRMNSLIDALLNFSRVARIELSRETVDLSAMATEVAAELRLAEPERRVTVRIAEGITADGDAKLLRAVLDNLLGNAWKYTGAQEEAVIDFGQMDIDGRQAYFVRDNGPGFAMADAENLFIPFQRLPGAEEFKGFGIGLATVERIVRRHGGRIWAEGEPGKGATFYFTLRI